MGVHGADRRFARDVLPPLQAHRVQRVPLAEEVGAFSR